MIHPGRVVSGGYTSIKKMHGGVRWTVAGGDIGRSGQMRPLQGGGISCDLKHEKGLVA